jgi:hypothetical protein
MPLAVVNHRHAVDRHSHGRLQLVPVLVPEANLLGPLGPVGQVPFPVDDPLADHVASVGGAGRREIAEMLLADRMTHGIARASVPIFEQVVGRLAAARPVADALLASHAAQRRARAGRGSDLGGNLGEPDSTSHHREWL